MPNEKDIGQKTLFDAADVFADILNVLIFDGKEVVLPEELVPTKQKSQLKIEGRLHEQERDVSKFWMKQDLCFVLFGLENQTTPDALMPFRVVAYDGVEYKAQVIQKNEEDKKKLPGERTFHPYPVITFVLYFGKTHWNKPRTIKEMFSDLPSEIEPYISDYKINVVEVSYLEPETVAKFQSDFRIVADYFAQTRKNEDYTPSDAEIRHVDEVLKLMAVLTGDDRFERGINEIREEGGPVTMCEVLDRVEKKGIEKGRLQEREKLMREYVCAFADLASPVEIAKRLNVSKEIVLKILQDEKLKPTV